MTRNYDAFTLAEVLITLVIIGVIAAMTIPTLTNNTNKQEYVSKLKKAYSTMAQATNSLIAEQGTPNASLGGWASSSESLLNLYKTKIPHADECIGASCINQYHRFGNNAVINFSTDDFSKLVLNDGSYVIFYMYPEGLNCTRNMHGTNNQCGGIIVDLNGDKKPDRLGYDVFYFTIKENGLHPHGCDADGYCNGPKNTMGLGCACKVLREGSINYR